MALTVRVEADPARPIGHARLVLRGTRVAATSAGFRLMREGYAKANLGPSGWDVTRNDLKPISVEQVGDEVMLTVGPEIVRHMEPGPAILALPADGSEAALFWPSDIDFFDGELPADDPVPVPPPRQPAAAQAITPRPQPAAVPPPPPLPQPVASERGMPPRALLILGLLLLLAGAAGGGWWFMQSRETDRSAQAEQQQAGPGAQQPQPPAEAQGGSLPPAPEAPGAEQQQGQVPPAPQPPAAEQQPPAPLPPAPQPPAAEQQPPAPLPPAPQPPAAEQQPPAPPAPQPQGSQPPRPPVANWPEGTDGLTVREVIERAPNAQSLHSAGMRRKEAGRHDDALDLLEQAAERGNAPSMTELGRLYDPNGFRPGQPFRAPDPRTAARYYRDAAQRGEPGAQAPREALRKWLEEQAPRNQAAADALKEFWP